MTIFSFWKKSQRFWKSQSAFWNTPSKTSIIQLNLSIATVAESNIRISKSTSFPLTQNSNFHSNRLYFSISSTICETTTTTLLKPKNASAQFNVWFICCLFFPLVLFLHFVCVICHKVIHAPFKSSYIKPKVNSHIIYRINCVRLDHRTKVDWTMAFFDSSC